MEDYLLVICYSVHPVENLFHVCAFTICTLTMLFAILHTQYVYCIYISFNNRVILFTK